MRKKVLLLAAALFIGVLSLSSKVPTSDRAAVAVAAVQRFHEIPKGVVLEGSAEGFEEITTLTYEKEKNEFTINGKSKYANPVDRRDFVSIFKALRDDDLMGVTLMDGHMKTYGKMSPSSKLFAAMADADKILGGVAYGLDIMLENVKLPGDYKPQKAVDRKIAVIAFTRLHQYMFDKKDDVYRRSSCNLDVSLIPLSEKKTGSGGHLPDEEHIKDYVMEDSDRANLDHLKTHQTEYFQIPCFATSVAAGEAAAFARLVRDSKVDAEVLLKSMR